MDYSTVTEQPRQRATRGQLDMMATRYGWAARHAAGNDVLEAACGAGLGLGCLARTAVSVEAGDIDESNVRAAEAIYGGCSKIRVRKFDAGQLPYPDREFDLLLMLEAIYYLSDARAFLNEARRVLRRPGTLLISSVNAAWRGFNPSPGSTRYLMAQELREELGSAGFRVRLFTGYPDLTPRAVAIIRRTAVKFGVVPRTMNGKIFLKRIFYGPVQSIPEQIEGTSTELFVPVHSGMDLTRYRVLYAEASL